MTEPNHPASPQPSDEARLSDQLRQLVDTRKIPSWLVIAARPEVMIRIGYMRLIQRGPLMTHDDVIYNRSIAHEIFGAYDVEFEEPRNILLWATLFYYFHVVEVYTPDTTAETKEMG